MFFEKISNDELVNLSNIKESDRIVCLFIKDVNLEAQLFLKLNSIAYKIIELINICGGIVKRSDLISISFQGDKNIYTQIRNLEKYNLIKLDGQRDSTICLTSTALSILKKKKVKNGIRFEKGTYDNLEKSKFILTLYKRDSLMFLNEFQFLDFIVNIQFDKLSSLNDSTLVKVKNKILNIYKECVQIDCYLLDENTTLAIYATSKAEFIRKYIYILNLKLNSLGANININKIIVLYSEVLEDLNVKELIELHKKKPTLGNQFESIEIIVIDK